MSRDSTAQVSANVRLLRRGRLLEVATLAWNVAGLVVLGFAAVAARSIALAGFGLDSLIEIGASTVVLWELSAVDDARQRRALRLIGGAFVALAGYLTAQSAWVLAARFHPHHSPLGIGWTALTAAVMFALAAGKARTGRALANPVLVAEGRVTAVDGLLAVAVLIGLVLNAVVGWWWADPLAAGVLVFYAAREAFTIFARHETPPADALTQAPIEAEGFRRRGASGSAAHTRTRPAPPTRTAPPQSLRVARSR